MINPPNSKKTLKELEIELSRITLAYEQMVKQVKDKNSELLESNHKLQAEIVERKGIEAEMLEMTQEEQRRFGSQLHDGLCQELTAISVFAKALTQKMEKDKTLELTELKRISDMLLNAISQARDTARGLYPGELEGNSLMHSLEELTLNTRGASCVFICPKPIFIEDKNTATHLYRMVQEGISNAIKHGKAKNIKIAFTQNKENTKLVIKDDGVGMLEENYSSKGIGLKIMKYRSHIMNAAFTIKANFPHGVILECSLKNPKQKGTASA